MFFIDYFSHNIFYEFNYFESFILANIFHNYHLIMLAIELLYIHTS